MSGVSRRRPVSGSARHSAPASGLTAAIASCLLAMLLAGCGAATVTPGAPASHASSSGDAGATDAPASSTTGVASPSPRTILVDTDVAPDDLVALSFLVAAPSVDVAAITVSGTGEAHCAGGVDVVLRLLERLEAPDIPVACGRESPLAGTHAFPDAWRAGADSGSGLSLPATSRTPADDDAVALIGRTVAAHPGLTVLTLGPLTNLADAVHSDAAIAGDVAAVVVMGGAVNVPGNLLGPDAPTGNTAAEWNVYVDPTAAQVVVDTFDDVRLVSLDGTNQVPVTRAYADRVRSEATGTGARVLADLFDAIPFMTSGDYYLWDPLAAMLAAGYEVGTFTPVGIEVEQAEGAESGFTRPTGGEPNASFLEAVDPAAAEDTLLAVLNGS
jgi:inosine-uridine nucleoside N-ribohydrolase